MNDKEYRSTHIHYSKLRAKLDEALGVVSCEQTVKGKAKATKRAKMLKADLSEFVNSEAGRIFMAERCVRRLNGGKNPQEAKELQPASPIILGQMLEQSA